MAQALTFLCWDRILPTSVVSVDGCMPGESASRAAAATAFVSPSPASRPTSPAWRVMPRAVWNQTTHERVAVPGHMRIPRGTRGLSTFRARIAVSDYELPGWITAEGQPWRLSQRGTRIVAARVSGQHMFWVTSRLA